MKYYIKLSIDGAFPSGVEYTGKFEIPEKMYDYILKEISYGRELGTVCKV
jgi:activator of HSP90 ATPase